MSHLALRCGCKNEDRAGKNRASGVKSIVLNRMALMFFLLMPGPEGHSKEGAGGGIWT